MIFGNIKTYKSFGMSTAALDKYIEVFKTITPDIEAGRYELEDGAFYNVTGIVNQVPADENLFESHEKYIDIQYVFEGTEIMEFADIADLTVTQPLNTDEDYALYTGKGTLITFKTGDFAVFTPMDGHKPGCGNGTSRRVIIKVPVK